MSHLAHTLLEPAQGEAERWMVFLHGILGSRSNWRSFARRMLAARPGWGAILVDLRMHGDSQDLDPPHTVAAAVGDLLALDRHLDLPVRGILGHSFGGKVALGYVERTDALEEAWLIDSMPGPRVVPDVPDSPRRVLAALRELPSRFDDRPAFVAAVEGRGISGAVAQWLAMNLRRGEDGQRLGLDLGAIEALMDDYASIDAWPVLRRPPGGVVIRAVVSGRSGVWTEEDIARAEQLRPRGVELTRMPDVGHWIHVEDPAGLLALMRSEFSRS